MYLYDANMCGTGVDENSALDWRSDCHTYDQNATYNGTTVDVSGGYHDAGDHVKFGLPQAYSASVLGYGYYEFKDAYTQTGQADHIETISTYFAEYFKNCTVMQNGKVTAFCYQVGDGTTDHSEWCTPESQTLDRPTYWATSSNPATDIVSNTAGALALHYKNFGDQESLTYAKALYEFAKTNSKAVATDGVSGFYSSDSYIDDLMWAAAALYIATGDTSYVSDANKFLSDYGNSYAFCSNWALCWGNMWPLVNLTFGQLGSSVNADMMNQVVKTMDEFMNNYNTSEGYASFESWGSARYNTAMQLVGLAYDKINGTNKYGTWAKSQMDYLLGDNNNQLCYLTGFSSNSVSQPHHRAATGYDGFPSENKGVPYANTLIGALVGGPDKNGTYVDDVEEYTYSEVAIDYNAGLVGAMAGLYLLYGLYGSGQSVDSSIVGVNGTSSTTTTTTTTVTTAATSATSESTSESSSAYVSDSEATSSTSEQGVETTTTTTQAGGSNVLSSTNVQYNSDGTTTLLMYVNTGDSDTVTLNLKGLAGYTASGTVGYWDSAAGQWVSGKDWSGTFDSDGNLTSDVTVPTNTDDVQIQLYYYADWSTGSEVAGDKSQIQVVSIVDGSTSSTTAAVDTTTAPTDYSEYTTTTTTTASVQTGGSNVLSSTNVQYNSDGTDTLIIHVNTTDSDTVTLTLKGLAGYTTSGEVGYWDNSASQWVGKVDTWGGEGATVEHKFDSDGNLTISGIKVPTNTNDVQIMVTYYASWATGSEVLGDKSQIQVVSVVDGSSSGTVTTVSTYGTSSTAYTTTAVSTTANTAYSTIGTTTTAGTSSPVDSSTSYTVSTTAGSSSSSGLKGDVNSSGSVDGRDLITLKKYVLGLVGSSEINQSNSDVNGDGSVDGRDLILLKKYVLGLVSSL
jgi:hypothetical protein